LENQRGKCSLGCNEVKKLKSFELEKKCDRLDCNEVKKLEIFEVEKKCDQW
jgi:hypothetical protein